MGNRFRTRTGLTVTGRSIREFDSLPDRIRHSRQSDQRAVVVVEGPSDQRLLDRVTEKQWALYPAGTRDKVIAVVERTIELGVSRLAGLIDRDFDNAARASTSRGLPVVSFDEADLEAALINEDWFDGLVLELSSPIKLAINGGVESLRESAIKMATLVGLVRRENALHSWGINFDDVEIHQRIDARTLTLKVQGFSSVACRCSGGSVSESEIRRVLATEITYPPPAGSFRGKDALALVQVALKRIYGEKRIENADILPAMLRLSVDKKLLDMVPFPQLAVLLA